MDHAELQKRLKKGNVKIAIAGSETEFREWLTKEGKSDQDYFYPDDENALRLLRVAQVDEIVKIGDFHEGPLAFSSKVKVLEAELRDWKKMYGA